MTSPTLAKRRGVERARRRIGIIVGMSAIITLTTAGTAFALATFAGEDGSCDGGDVCMWKDDAGTGYYFTTPSADSNYGNNRWFSFDVSPANEVDSVRNRWTIDIGIYTGTSYTGTQWCFPSAMNYIHTFGSANDNIHESHKSATFNC